MTNFRAINGKVLRIEDVNWGDPELTGCSKMIAVLDTTTGSEVNFVLSPETYVLDQEMIMVGDTITGYIDGNAPTILIYPPQYQALAVVKENPDQNVKVAYFNDKLVSHDNQLKINPSPYTIITTTNGQAFTQSVANHNLVVIYGISTKSIPAITTPERIVVLC